LAERPGQLVSKEELLECVWPGVHVGPDVLKVMIAGIRRVLADPSREPRIIETAHRRGYRFIAQTELPTDVPTFESGLPATHYARSGDVNIAYQVLGKGPLDLVFVMGWVSHLEYFWTEPSFARFLQCLASFARLIVFDKRGTGLSDRVPVHSMPTLEQRMDDVRAVMDAVGSTRAALCGVSDGVPPLVGRVPEELGKPRRRRRADAHEFRGGYQKHPARDPGADARRASYGRPLHSGGRRAVPRESNSWRAVCGIGRC
jgi:hypothetical protein